MFFATFEIGHQKKKLIGHKDKKNFGPIFRSRDDLGHVGLGFVAGAATGLTDLLVAGGLPGPAGGRLLHRRQERPQGAHLRVAQSRLRVRMSEKSSTKFEQGRREEAAAARKLHPEPPPAVVRKVEPTSVEHVFVEQEGQ